MGEGGNVQILRKIPLRTCTEWMPGENPSRKRIHPIQQTMKTLQRLKSIIVIVCGTISTIGTVHAQNARILPVSPNASWRANLNGGGVPQSLPKTREGKILDAISDAPGLPSGELETDRAKLEQFKRRMQLEALRMQIERERLRRAQMAPGEICVIAEPQPKQNRVLDALIFQRKAAEWQLQQAIRERQKQPVIVPDIRPEWEREMWQRNQPLEGYMESK